MRLDRLEKKPALCKTIGLGKHNKNKKSNGLAVNKQAIIDQQYLTSSSAFVRARRHKGTKKSRQLSSFGSANLRWITIVILGLEKFSPADHTGKQKSLCNNIVADCEKSRVIRAPQVNITALRHLLLKIRQCIDQPTTNQPSRSSFQGTLYVDKQLIWCSNLYATDDCCWRLRM